jgi:hypothetical protein
VPFVVKVYLTVSFGCGYAALCIPWLKYKAGQATGAPGFNFTPFMLFICVICG